MFKGQDPGFEAAMSSAASVQNRFPKQSAANELANAVTHGIALVASLIGAVALVLKQTKPSLLMLTIVAYASSLVAVFAFSTLSHLVQSPYAKHRLRAWDQGVIYLLIAGTYTPMLATYTQGVRLLITMPTIWLMALVGCYTKVAVQHRVNALSTWSYIGLGWIPAIAFIGLGLPTECLRWVFWGGVSFTLGTVFLKFDQRIGYFHAVWHLFVVVGSACHYWVIYRFAVS